MRKRYLRTLAAVLSISLMGAMLGGCGDDDSDRGRDREDSNVQVESDGGFDESYDEGDDSSDTLGYDITLAIEDSVWESNELYFIFHADNTLEVTYQGDPSSESGYGEYEWDGKNGQYTFQGMTVNMSIDEDGDFYFWDDSGDVVYLTFAGMYDTFEYGDGDSSSSGEVSSDGNITYEVLDNGYMRYTDYNNDISITYPQWMTSYDDIISGTVTISAGDGSYVVGQNITDMYWDYSGSDDEMIAAYVNEMVTEYFTELYGGDWIMHSYSDMAATEDNQLAVAECNLYNDDNDVYIQTIVYRTVEDGAVTDTVMAQSYFSYYDDYYDNGGAQHWTLYNEVTGLSDAY